MTKKTQTEQQGPAQDTEKPAGSQITKTIEKTAHPAHPAAGKSKPPKRKVFFNTVDQLTKKKADYESKLAQLQGAKNKRKRLNTLKVIMQINRAIKNQDECIKDPEELARKRHKDRLKRVTKKLEKKRMREIVQNVREEEKYGVSHTYLQTHK